MNSKPVVYIGSTVALASLAFICVRLWAIRAQLLAWHPDTTALFLLIGAALVYGSANFLLASAWRRLLLWFGQEAALPGVCRSIYAKSQIAKYVPGNILHIAGRHVLARNAGFSHGPLVLAALYEILLLLVAAGGMALFGWSVFGITQAPVSALSLFAVAVGLPFLALVLAKYLPRFPLLRKHELPDRPLVEILSGLGVPLFQYLLFFLIAGLVLLATSYMVRGTTDYASAGAVVSLFALAWIVGFITPGAPSGIGIREGIMVVALSGSVGEASALLIALVFRVVTISGDVIFFVFGTDRADKVPRPVADTPE